MAKCKLHPGRVSVMEYNRVPYCHKCQDGMTSARNTVPDYFVPRDCFIWYRGNDHWERISGDPCAHWVAHQLRIQAGALNERCLLGFTFRVPTLIERHTEVAVSDVRLDDIWVNHEVHHTGLVIQVFPSLDENKNPTITIRHDSSGQKRLADNDFDQYFHGDGFFVR